MIDALATLAVLLYACVLYAAGFLILTIVHHPAETGLIVLAVAAGGASVAAYRSERTP